MSSDLEQFRAVLKGDIARAVVDAQISMALACVAFAEQRWRDGAEDIKDAVALTVMAARIATMLGGHHDRKLRCAR